MNTCKNCGEEVTTDFCGFCGQRSSIHKVTFKETFDDFMNVVFSVNAPLWTTLKLLVVNPGKLFREYLNGKRKSYYKPIAFFILTTILYLLLRSVIAYDPMDNQVITQEGVINSNLFQEAGRFMVANINNIMFILVFTLGLFFKLFFYKRNTLAEFLALSFYLVGMYTLLGVLSMFYLKFVNQHLKMLPMLLFFLYIVFAFISFFKTAKLGSIIKMALAYLFAIIFYVSLGYGLSLLIVWLKTG